MVGMLRIALTSSLCHLRSLIGSAVTSRFAMSTEQRPRYTPLHAEPLRARHGTIFGQVDRTRTIHGVPNTRVMCFWRIPSVLTSLDPCFSIPRQVLELSGNPVHGRRVHHPSQSQEMPPDCPGTVHTDCIRQEHITYMLETS